MTPGKIFSVALLGFLTSSLPAMADQASPEPPSTAVEPPAASPEPTPRAGPRSYAEQTGAYDAMAGGLLFLSVPVMVFEALAQGICVSDSCPPAPSLWQQMPVGLTMAGLGAALYALGPPAVHAGHGHPRKALLDLGMRVAAPVALGALGYGIGEVAAGCFPKHPYPCSGSDPPGPLIGVLGVLGGMAVASAVDAALLAKETPGEATASARWSPTIAPASHGGASVGIAGSF